MSDIHAPEIYTILNSQDNPAEGNFTDKKSEFIGIAIHAETAEHAEEFIRRIREEHPKARHVAWASIRGSLSDRSERMSDDGEPGGTAGKPILEALKQNDMTDCAIAVVRYFGGILLGAGGLVRAYSAAACAALGQAKKAAILRCERTQCSIEYPRHDMYVRIVKECSGTVYKENFAQDVTVIADIPSSNFGEFSKRITEVFRAQTEIKSVGQVSVPVPVSASGDYSE